VLVLPKKGKLKVGVIGLGWAGREHLKKYAVNPRADVVGVADVVPEAADRVAEIYGIKAYYDPLELLDQDGLGAVSVCTPNVYHAPLAIEAAKRGVSAMTEKPMCTTSAEGKRMVGAHKASGTKLMVAVCRRFEPGSIFLKKLIESGYLGTINLGRCHWFRHNGNPGRWFKEKNLSGGGPMLDIGVHLLDLTWWLMGSPRPTYCLGRSYGSAEENAVEDLAAGAITFETGQIIHVGASWISGWKGETASILVGTEGGASRYPLEIYKDIAGVPTSMTPELDNADSFQAEVDHFVECVLGDKEPIPNGVEGWNVVKMLEAVYKSSERQRPVKIP
jgi:predicted dehydrogenase